MTSAEKLQRIDRILWPPEDPDEQWTPDTTSDVANVFGDEGRPTGRTEEDRVLIQVYDTLYPPEEPDRQWSADTIEDIGWIVQSYNERHQNPAGIGWTPILVSAGLAVAGIFGIVMARREVRRSTFIHAIRL